MKRSRNNTFERVDNAPCSINESRGLCKNELKSDGDFAQVTKLVSAPHKCLRKVFPGKAKLPVSPAKMLLGREFNYSGRGRFSLSDSCHVLNRYIPTYNPSIIDQLRGHACISQYSADGSLLVSVETQGHIRIYDVDLRWKIHKDIQATNIEESITDTCLSHDGRFLVYSALSPIVGFVNMASAVNDYLSNETEIHEGLVLNSSHNEYIMSVKFSPDGRQIVAGGSKKSLYFYDLETRKLSLRVILAHKTDVNSVCYADESGNIIYSGSDDNLCKVWDRRCLGRKGEPVGGFVGHKDGITFVDTRGDGRYLITNGKDCTIKLWDTRKMLPNHVLLSFNCPELPSFYRHLDYVTTPSHANPVKDVSLATYCGHSVFCTRIRCYFSPAYSTGQKYIYTGSGDSSVYIYDVVTTKEVARLNYHKYPVIDCSWHPLYPEMVTSCWDGKIVKWEFPGNSVKPAPIEKNKRMPLQIRDAAEVLQL